MLPDIESNNNIIETNDILPSYKLHICFKIYMLLASSSLIGITIYGIIHSDKYTIKQINYFYIIFLTIILLPALLYNIYLHWKCTL